MRGDVGKRAHTDLEVKQKSGVSWHKSLMSFPLFMSFPRRRESRDMYSYPAWIPACAGMTTGGYLHPLCFGKVVHETWGEHARHDAYSCHQAPVCRGQGRPRLRGFLAFIVLPPLEGVGGRGNTSHPHPTLSPQGRGIQQQTWCQASASPKRATLKGRATWGANMRGDVGIQAQNNTGRRMGIVIL